MSDAKRGTVIAQVAAGTPPETVRTLADWLTWRSQEDERMAADLAAQVEAHLERTAGAQVH